jgi:hypothetical protein
MTMISGGVRRVFKPVSAHHNFPAEIAHMRDRSAEGGAPQLQKYEQNFER